MTFHREHTIVTSASAEAIWRRWTSVELWPEDDPDCRWARISGDYVVGASGQVKTGGPAARFTVTQLEPHRLMCFEIKLPGAVMSFPHTAEPVAQGIRLTHGITITGPLTPLYSRLVGGGVAAGLPTVVALVANNALSQAGEHSEV
jgi:hypothetical protein